MHTTPFLIFLSTSSLRGPYLFVRTADGPVDVHLFKDDFRADVKRSEYGRNEVHECLDDAYYDAVYL